MVMSLITCWLDVGSETRRLNMRGQRYAQGAPQNDAVGAICDVLASSCVIAAVVMKKVKRTR